MSSGELDGKAQAQHDGGRGRCVHNIHACPPCAQEARRSVKGCVPREVKYASLNKESHVLEVPEASNLFFYWTKERVAGRQAHSPCAWLWALAAALHTCASTII